MARTRLAGSLWLVVVLMEAAAAAYAATPAAETRVRQTIPLSQGWRFQLGAVAEAARQPAFDDSAWERVTVPHNWNRLGGTAEREPAYQNVYGSGWYRLSFIAPGSKGKRAWLQFDGASLIADVWLNGVHLGQHKGAFARFRFDATAALTPSGINVLVVRADNSKATAPGSSAAEVIPISGDWPMYGGLYRQVSLVLTDPVHIEMMDHGGPGVYARTVSVKEDGALIAILTRVRNDSGRNSRLRVTASVIDNALRTVGSVSHAAPIASRTEAEIRQSVKIAQPRLWQGIEDPYLYRVKVEVRNAAGTLIDEVQQPLGIRTIRIDPDAGFFLNGKPLRLHGVAKHQDYYAKGWAIDAEDYRSDMALIRELGANTVRYAHYQHDQFAFDLADQNGIIAWAEIPLVDRTAPLGAQETTPAFSENAQQQLRELIRQNYNHPSIAVWSIGNEVNLAAAKGLTVSNARPLLKSLHELSRAEDPWRPTVLADCCGAVPGEARPGLDSVMGITDVVGLNRYFGWYGRKLHDLDGELKRIHAMYPQQAISVSEYGAGGALTQHTDNPLGGPIHAFGRPHPEAFQTYWLEESWKQIRPLPFVWASWVWNFADFSNDERREGDLIDTNDKGLVTFDRKTRKDAFYFFKANWSSEPVVHIANRRHVERAHPVTQVKVYSNAPEVQLRVGDRDLGSATCTDGICLWEEVALTPGNNTLVASAEINGQPLSNSVRWRLVGKPGSYRIRAGHLVGARTANDVLYGSDDFFSGGEGRDRDAPPASRGASPAPPNPVADAKEQAPYESYREGRFSYRLPVPNGKYGVLLRFFEPVKDQKRGARVFDVTAEGRPVLKSFDIVAAAGRPWRAVDRRSTVTVTDGYLDLQFEPRTGQALVAAIEVHSAAYR